MANRPTPQYIPFRKGLAIAGFSFFALFSIFGAVSSWSAWNERHWRSAQVVKGFLLYQGNRLTARYKTPDGRVVETSRSLREGDYPKEPVPEKLDYLPGPPAEVREHGWGKQDARTRLAVSTVCAVMFSILALVALAVGMRNALSR
jgi:hypothetical protein